MMNKLLNVRKEGEADTELKSVEKIIAGFIFVI